MKRFRIDFTIRELDCPPEEARGITFGDEVDSKSIFDFFNRCRDAAVTLFNGTRPRVAEDELAEVKRQLEAEKQKARMRNQGVAQAPVPIRDVIDLEKMWGSTKDPVHHLRQDFGDDGSRGGDGPPSAEYLARVAAAKKQGGPGEW
jgi:hypothetical protein